MCGPIHCPFSLSLHVCLLAFRSLDQSVVTQTSAVSKPVDQIVTISCTGSSSKVGAGDVFWYQQQLGSVRSSHLWYDSNKHQGPGVPSRLSGSKDALANAGLLLISGLQPEDKADYYCAIGHSSGSNYHYSQ
uniref:Ig-like domain-containing protein n=1 Tax=Suricata suricatta TaxID=37032 RepID=A0A673UI78_SURSU